MQRREIKYSPIHKAQTPLREGGVTRIREGLYRSADKA